MVDGIVSLPLIYTGNSAICNFVGFLKAYMELMMLIIGFLMVYTGYRLIFPLLSESVDYTMSIKQQLGVLLLPLVVVIPLFTNSYGDDHADWCYFRDDLSGITAYILYMWLSTFVIAVSVALLSYLLSKLTYDDYETAKRVFFGIGSYAVTTILCWIPKYSVFIVLLSEPKDEYDEHDHYHMNQCMYVSRIFISVASLLYLAIFLCEKDALKSFEDFAGQDRHNTFVVDYSESVSSSRSPSLYSETLSTDFRSSRQCNKESSSPLAITLMSVGEIYTATNPITKALVSTRIQAPINHDTMTESVKNLESDQNDFDKKADDVHGESEAGKDEDGEINKDGEDSTDDDKQKDRNHNVGDNPCSNTSLEA
jgi:hypothetical protein